MEKVAGQLTIVTFEYFQQTIEGLTNRLETLESEVNLHKELMPALVWMDRQQALKFLCCSSTQLWNLQKRKKIGTTQNGSKTLYKTETLRNYLLSQSTEIQEVNKRLKNIFSNLLDTDSI